MSFRRVAVLLVVVALAAAAPAAAAGGLSRAQARGAVWHWWRGRYLPRIVAQRDIGTARAIVTLRVRFGDGQDRCVHGLDYYRVSVTRRAGALRVHTLDQRLRILIVC